MRPAGSPEAPPPRISWAFMIGRSVERATMIRRPLGRVRSATAGTAATRAGPGAGGAMRWPSGSRELGGRTAGGTVTKVGTGAGLRQLSSGTPSGRWLSSR